MKTTENKNKHMTLDERIEIQECLSKGLTFKAIGIRIGKDQTTVSKEVKHHKYSHTNSFCKCEDICPKLQKAPFVCNGCEKRYNSSCHFIRLLYDVKRAQQDYEIVLKDSRIGVALNHEEFYETEKIISNVCICQ